VVLSQFYPEQLAVATTARGLSERLNDRMEARKYKTNRPKNGSSHGNLAEVSCIKASVPTTWG